MIARTILTVGIAAVCVLGVPMAAAANPPQLTNNAEVASNRANMALLDRFYLAVGAKDEAALAELVDGAMIWIGGKGSRFVKPASFAPGAVFESVFGPGVGRLEDFGASASLYLPSGSHVVALGQYAGYERAADDLLDTEFAHVFTFADGRLVHFQPYTNFAPGMDVVTAD